MSSDLVNAAPQKMPEIVRQMHATAAQALEDAATMLEHEMQSHVQLMRDEAATLRTQGESQANTIEALSTLIRDTHNAFQSQAEKLAQFRAGDVQDAQTPPSHDNLSLKLDTSNRDEQLRRLSELPGQTRSQEDL